MHKIIIPEKDNKYNGGEEIFKEIFKEFLFQSQRKTMPKNVQITIQLHSFHILTI